jgi:RNA recognition motif-containing protein
MFDFIVISVVEFASSSDMEAAIKKFDDYEYEGRRLVVKEVG